MKYLQIFGLLFLVQLLVWSASHVYFSTNKTNVLVVADTSYSMKQSFPKVQRWIEDFERSSRYSNILIGTDKASLGQLADITSKEVIFRTSFGKLTTENLTRLYTHVAADKRILLSDGSLNPSGWDVVEF